MEFIKSLANNEWFIVITGTASVLGLLFGKNLKKIFIRQKDEKQSNVKQKQSQGNQQNGNNNIIMKQSGSNNKQAGRDIRG